jgi:PAS domain S-box-containing protein
MMAPARDDDSPLQDSADLSGAYPDKVGHAHAKAVAVAMTAEHPDAGQDVAPELFRRLVSSVRDYAIFALDPTGHIMTWNEGAERIKGYAASEIIGKHFSVFYPSDKVAEGFPDYELRTAAAQGRFEDEGWRIRKDGSRFWASVIITALRDDDEQLIGFAKVTRDLTERRAAEEELRLSEERFRLIVQTVRDYAIFMLDPSGLIATWNAGAERINGYEGNEIIGRHFSIFYPPEDREWDKPAWELREATRDGRFEDEGWRVRKDGTRFWSNVVITALRDHDGRLVGFAKVTRDLTERRAAEQRSVDDARRIAAAEAANRVKAEFLTVMSHELRTPLNAIGGYSDLLEMGVAGPVTEQQREYLERIRTSKQHLLGLINDVLNYSRIEAGQTQYQMGDVSLKEVVQSTVLMVTPQATAKHIAVVVADSGADLTAWADRFKVDQIMLNLLSNAVKFTPEGGRIQVGFMPRAGKPSLTVTDTGPGIEPEKWSAIFEPFVQLERSFKNPQEGTGLGLAISRDLARGMGGDLFVESPRGRGATFTLVLRPAG